MRVERWSAEELGRREGDLATLIRRAWRAVARSVVASLLGKHVISVNDAGLITDGWGVALDKHVLTYVTKTLLDAAEHVRDATSESDLDVARLMPDVAEWYLAQARNRLVGVGDDVWYAVREQLIVGQQAGEGVETLALRVRDTTGVSHARSLVIARTEVHAAHEAGTYEQARLVDADGKKTWLCTHDDRTRESHRLACDQTVLIREAFVVGGSRLRYPGDPLGEPNEVINCRCSAEYEFDLNVEQPNGKNSDKIEPVSDTSDETSVVAAAWTPEQVKEHPRGNDGKFIEKTNPFYDALTTVGSLWSAAVKATHSAQRSDWEHLTTEQQHKLAGSIINANKNGKVGAGSALAKLQKWGYTGPGQVPTKPTTPSVPGKAAELLGLDGKPIGKSHPLFHALTKKVAHETVVGQVLDSTSKSDWDQLTLKQQHDVRSQVSNALKAGTVNADDALHKLDKWGVGGKATPKVTPKKAAAPAVVPHGGKPTKSVVTTKLIWGTHADGAVVAENTANETRLVWNDKTKKYDQQARKNDKWVVVNSYSKKGAYENFKGQDEWVTPGKAVPSPTKTTAAPGKQYVGDAASPLARMRKILASPTVDPAELFDVAGRMTVDDWTEIDPPHRLAISKKLYESMASGVAGMTFEHMASVFEHVENRIDAANEKTKSTDLGKAASQLVADVDDYSDVQLFNLVLSNVSSKYPQFSEKEIVDAADLKLKKMHGSEYGNVMYELLLQLHTEENDEGDVSSGSELLDLAFDIESGDVPLEQAFAEVRKSFPNASDSDIMAEAEQLAKKQNVDFTALRAEFEKLKAKQQGVPASPLYSLVKPDGTPDWDAIQKNEATLPPGYVVARTKNGTYELRWTGHSYEAWAREFDTGNWKKFHTVGQDQLKTSLSTGGTLKAFTWYGVTPEQQHPVDTLKELEPSSSSTFTVLSALTNAQVAQVKQQFKDQTTGTVGYWSKPSKIWDAIKAVQALHPDPNDPTRSSYSPLAIIDALDTGTKTKQPMPYQKKIVDWMLTPQGKQYAGDADQVMSIVGVPTPHEVGVAPAVVQVVTPKAPKVPKTPSSKNAVGLPTVDMSIDVKHVIKYGADVSVNDVITRALTAYEPGGPDIVIAYASQGSSHYRVVATSGVPGYQVQTRTPSSPFWSQLWQHASPNYLKTLIDGYAWHSAANAKLLPPAPPIEHPLEGANVNVSLTIKNNQKLTSAEVIAKLATVEPGRIIAYWKSGGTKYRIVRTEDERGFRIDAAYGVGAYEWSEVYKYVTTPVELATILAYRDVRTAEGAKIVGGGVVPKPDDSVSKFIAQAGDISHISQDARTSLYEYFKLPGKPGKHLIDKPEEIYALVQEVRNHFSGKTGFGELTDLQVLRIIDDRRQQKYGEATNLHLYENKIVNWLKTPAGKKHVKIVAGELAVVTKPKKGVTLDVSTASLTHDRRTEIYAAFKALSKGQLLGSSNQDVFANVWGLSELFSQREGFGDVSMLDVLRAVDEGAAEALGKTNLHLFEQKVVDWHGTSVGREYALSQKYRFNPVLKEIFVQSEVSVPKGVTLLPGEKVHRLTGPGSFDPALHSNDFNRVTSGEMGNIQGEMLAARPWTPGERAALRSYTSGAYTALNGYLRGKSGYLHPSQNARGKILRMQEGMRPSTANVLTIRGSGWEALPEAYRTLEAAKGLVGTVIDDPGFVSSSAAGSGGNFAGSVMMEIEIPRGTPVAFVKSISHNPSENEVLLAAGTKFQVTHVTANGYGGVTVRVRVVS